MLLYESGIIPKINSEYNIINIISGNKETLSNIYPDDTNLQILNKICLTIKEHILTSEIFAFTNDYNILGFNYDKKINMGQIFNGKKINKSSLKQSDPNFMDELENKKSILRNNNLYKLFENNFPIIDNNIYYFTLKDLIELNGDINNKFIYSVIYKYFPNITKKYIENYDNVSNKGLRNSHYKKINTLIGENDALLNVLDDNQDQQLNEDTFNINLLKYNFENEENYINIIKLFSDFELTKKYLFTKLILDNHENTYYKIYKPELKLKLSDNSSIIDKTLCSRLISDYKDNVNTPLNLGYIPSFAQPKNCLVIKTYLKDVKLFFSFFLYINGETGITINNYYNISINNEILNTLFEETKKLINEINKYRIYSINKIPRNINSEKNNIHFINSEISFSMDKFMNEKGSSIYLPENIINFLGNFHTHVRIMKEKMDFHLTKDDIIIHYKRCNDYATLDVIQSIITSLNNPDNNLTSDQMIELVSKNTGISMEQATKEYQKWVDNNYDMDDRRYSLKTKETGSEIIINRYLNKFIRFQIFNVHSYEELKRIIKFIKIFMNLYKLFISKKLDKSTRALFTKITKIKSKKIQEVQQIQGELEQDFIIEISDVPTLPKKPELKDEDEQIIMSTSSSSLDFDDLVDSPKSTIKSQKSTIKSPTEVKSLTSVKSHKKTADFQLDFDDPGEEVKEAVKEVKKPKSEKVKKDKEVKEEVKEEVKDDDEEPDEINFDNMGDTTSTTTGGGGSSEEDKQMYKINQGKESYSALNNLKSVDPILFKPKKDFSYPKKCGVNQGIRMPIALYDLELEKVDKNDILKTAKIKNSDGTFVKLPQEIYHDLLTDKTKKKEDIIKELDDMNAIYSENFRTYHKKLSQSKIGEDKNINYICPKYWDVSKNVSVHPRDIYDQLDKIIPPKFKGTTSKYIIDKEGVYFKYSSETDIKKHIIDYIKNKKHYELYEKYLNSESKEIVKESLNDSIRIISSNKKKKHSFESVLEKEVKTLDISKDIIANIEKEKNEIFKKIDDDNKDKQLYSENFNNYMKENIPSEIYDLIHQEIVQSFQPRFFDHKEGDKLYPCCFNYSPKFDTVDVKEDKDYKLNKDDIRISELTPSNINKFAHVHVKLQNELFNHDNSFHDNKRNYGGFIKYGVKQGNNALLYTLSNLHYGDNNSYKDFETTLKTSLTGDNSLYIFLKIADGNMVQLFKSEEYDINDIQYFLDYLVKSKSHFKKIYIDNGHIKKIKRHLNNFKTKLHSDINSVPKKERKKYFKEKKYDYINQFTNLIYESDKSLNIKFIYDLIISKNNYYKYLFPEKDYSDEIKDYKYVIPLVSAINPNNVYVIFENVKETISIKLPFNKYNITDKSVFKFIYKIDNIYEPIHYFNEKMKFKDSDGNEAKMTCDIKKDLHTDKRVNNYINNIFEWIKKEIESIYRDKYIDINIFELDDLLSILHKNKDNDTGIKLLVDNYCKISHVITNKKHIYPVVPSGIIDGYKLVYDFGLDIPTFGEYLDYSSVKVIRNKFRISGFIKNNTEEIINIVFDNNAYIPIKPIEYNKKNKDMKKHSVIGNKDLFLIDKGLQNFIPGNDERFNYNTDVNYIKYINNLTIQNIIFYIKNTDNSVIKEYYTDKKSDYETNTEYTFNIKPNNEKDNFVIKNNDMIDYFYFYEPNKFKGIVKNIGNTSNGLTKLSINVNPLNELYLILNDNIKINFDKENDLYNYIKGFIDDIVVELSDKDYENYKLNKNVSICFENSNKDCQYPCFNDSGKCKLYVKKTSIYDKDNKSLIDKIIWKFVDLLLIHKDVDNINRILQDNININDLYKTVNIKEVYFNYSQYVNKYLDDLFNYESEYIRNINFYDQFNENPISSNKSKPVTSILKGVPNIIRQLFKSECNILTYVDENNLDFISISRVIKDIFNDDIDPIKLKSEICDVLDKIYKGNKFRIINEYNNYNKKEKNKIKKYIKENPKDKKYLDEIKLKINNNKYKISQIDLEILANKYDIGFLLITSKYSNQDPSKLKHNLVFKYNSGTLNSNTNIVLLYHYLNENDKYDLANIVVKVDDLDENDSYKTYLSFEDLMKIDKIKTIIENDYSDI